MPTSRPAVGSSEQIAREEREQRLIGVSSHRRPRLARPEFAELSEATDERERQPDSLPEWVWMDQQ
jgi:hypothetical protein